MTVYLQNPAHTAHLADLRDRLVAALACTSRLASGAGDDQAHVEGLVEVVRAMDHGVITTKDAIEIFARHPVPGFHFGRWLVEVVDEGVYLEEVFNDAA